MSQDSHASRPGAGIIRDVARTGNKSRLHTATFFQQGTQRTLSHHEIDVMASRLAASLLEAGLQPGQHVGVIARNGLGWIVLDLACIKVGLVTAGFEFGRMKLTAEQVARFDLAAVYVEQPISDMPVLDVGPLVRDVLNQAIEVDVLPMQLATPSYEAQDVITVKFTSGSTGEPKGLGATVGSIEGSLSSVQAMYAHRDSDNLLVFLPLSLLQQRYWVYSALVFGHDVTIASFEYALDAARIIRPTVIMGVPGFFEGVRHQAEREKPAIVNDLDARRLHLSCLLGDRIRYMWTGSAPAAAETLAFFDDAGLPLFEGYGMNETCIVSKNHPSAFRRGSVGQLLPNKRARIDEDGVLIVGSDHPVNTAYMYCQAGESEKVFRPGGEVYTGDLARFDDDGYLYILGRADDVVVLANGKNVHTRRIEEQVREHRSVGDCVIFGAGKPYLVAVLSLADPSMDPTDINAHIKALNALMKPDERIVKTYLAPNRFSVESGLLTSQFKPRRKEIYRVFSSQIEQLYR